MSGHSFKKGFSFGLTSGVITPLGLIVGLHSGTGSKPAVIGGILTIAIADAFSDALGIHISEEAEEQHSSKEIWIATLTTFISKLIFALTFILPFLFLDLFKAVVVSVTWGMLLLAFFSWFIARKSQDAYKVVLEHLFVGMLVVLISQFLGEWIASLLKE